MGKNHWLMTTKQQYLAQEYLISRINSEHICLVEIGFAFTLKNLLHMKTLTQSNKPLS
jgi:hypothetical protein